MNIQGYGTGSFADIVNSRHKRNQIPLVNQIVSYKDMEAGEIYRAYFTDNKVTSHNAVGQMAWQTAIKDASHAQKIKESLEGITLYSQEENDMSVSTIGNTYSYIYNYETKKLTTTDGGENEFTKYFNGEIEGHESETLNGFDKQRRSGFKDVLSLLEQGAFGKEKPAEDAELELSGKNIDADTIEFYVNGKRYLKCSVAPSLTYAEYEKCTRIWNSGKDYACTNNDGWAYPDEVYNKVLKRYEDWLNQPLSEVLDADAYRASLRSGNHSAIRESDSSDNGRAIGVTTVGNIGYIARYADSSTLDNPVIKIGDYEVLVNEVDPHNATQLEMFALLSYLDDTNQTNNTGMSSFSKLRSYAELAESNGFCEGIQDVNGFFDTNQNWEEIMRAIKEVFLGNPQTYEQALNCEKLINIMSRDENGISF